MARIALFHGALMGRLRVFLAAHAFLILIFVLLGLLWLYRLDSCRLWIDEFFSINIAQRPLDTIWSMVPHANKFYFNSMPPLYETLLHFVWDASGENLLLPQFLSLLLTGVAVFFVYKLALLLFDKTTALYAALFTALNSSYFMFAKMIRGYALLNALTLVSFYIFFCCLKREDRRGWLCAALLLVNTGILYTFYFGIFVVLVELLMVLFLFRDRASRGMVWWVVAAPLALLPWAAHVKSDLYREVAISLDVTIRENILMSLTERFVYAFASGPLCLAYAGLLVLAVAYTVMLWQKKDPAARYFTALSMILLLPTIAVNALTFRINDAMRFRYFFNYLFPCFILAAAVVRRMPVVVGRVALIFVVVCSLMASLQLRFGGDGKAGFSYPTDIAVLAEAAKAFPVPAGHKVAIEIETDLYMPLFVYYFMGPRYFRGVSYPDLWAGARGINAVSPVYRIYYNIAGLNHGMLHKAQVEALGIPWGKFSEYLMVNVWARPMNQTELGMRVDMESVKDRIAADFGVDPAKVLAAVDRAQRSRALRSIDKLNEVDWVYLVFNSINAPFWGERLFVDHYMQVVASRGFDGQLELVQRKELGVWNLNIYKVVKRHDEARGFVPGGGP